MRITVVLGVAYRSLPTMSFFYHDDNLQAPLYVGEPVTATATAVHIDGKRGIVTFETTCSDKDGKVLMTGKAKAMLENPKRE